MYGPWPYPSQPPQPHVVYVPVQVPPTDTKGPKVKRSKGPKIRKGSSLDEMIEAKIRLEEFISAYMDDEKKNKKEDKKPDKRKGLNWLELSLLIVFASIPIGMAEIMIAKIISRALPL